MKFCFVVALLCAAALVILAFVFCLNPRILVGVGLVTLRPAEPVPPSLTEIDFEDGGQISSFATTSKLHHPEDEFVKMVREETRAMHAWLTHLSADTDGSIGDSLGKLFSGAESLVLAADDDFKAFTTLHAATPSHTKPGMGSPLISDIVVDTKDHIWRNRIIDSPNSETADYSEQYVFVLSEPD